MGEAAPSKLDRAQVDCGLMEQGWRLQQRWKRGCKCRPPVPACVASSARRLPLCGDLRRVARRVGCGCKPPALGQAADLLVVRLSPRWVDIES